LWQHLFTSATATICHNAHALLVSRHVAAWSWCRYDTLVAGGGDGTLNELVAALLKHDAPPHISIAQLPLGTANDLASAAGISLVSGSFVWDIPHSCGAVYCCIVYCVGFLCWALPTTWPQQQASHW
jgi:hypothetical protein